MAKDDLLSLAGERLADWKLRAGLWYALYYVFGSIAVLLTITVASHPDFVTKEALSALAWLAAIFQGLATFLVALPKAMAYRAAWRTVWLAKANFVDSDGADDSRQRLKQAIETGWAIIDGGYTEAHAQKRAQKAIPLKKATR